DCDPTNAPAPAHTNSPSLHDALPISGKAIERASIRELEELIEREYPGTAIDRELEESEAAIDPYPVFRMLLLPLENVHKSREHQDRKSTRLNSSHRTITYAVFCLTTT